MRKVLVAGAGLILIGGVALFITVRPRIVASAVQTVADSVLVLNRTGHWSEAERIGTKTLQRASAVQTMVARCQLTEGVAYAQVRQKAHAHASATLKLYEGACTQVQSLGGFTQEAVQLRAEIDTALALRKG